jgi:hypothetical protein
MAILLLGMPVLVATGYLVDIGPYWTYASAALAIVVVVCGFVLIGLGVILGTTNTSYRVRIFCLTSIFIGLVFLFGMLYAIIAARQPDAFRVSDALLDSRIREDIDREHREILYEGGMQFAATSIEANAPRVWLATHEHGSEPIGYRGYAGRCVLPGGVVFWHLIGVTSVGNSAPVYNEWFTVDDSTGQQLVKFADVSSFVDPRGEMNRDLLYSRTPTDVILAARKFARRVNEMQAASSRRMEDILRRRTHLDMSYYLYFSASVMTTVGSSDIAPANKLTRYLTIFQAFIAIFFIGFALNFLWPQMAREG